jgi:hypothetical protein
VYQRGVPELCGEFLLFLLDPARDWYLVRRDVESWLGLAAAEWQLGAW